MKTLAETICELSREHCRAGGLIMGQNLEAVQNVCGTVPVGEPGVTIMPTCEAAGVGMAIGAALTGKPVIHVIRFASFLWMQAAPIVYYAARCKSQWGYDLPLFIRVSSDDGIGPTHSGTYHSLFAHMPGLKVVAPMTPGEYRDVWTDFQETRQPVLVSEHRRSYSNALEMPLTCNSPLVPDVLIIAISAARLDALDALEILRIDGISAEVYPLCNLKPSAGEWLKLVNRARAAGNVLIVDSGYESCSISEHIGLSLYKFIQNDELNLRVLGMRAQPDINSNGSPSAQDIARAACEMLE